MVYGIKTHQRRFIDGICYLCLGFFLYSYEMGIGFLHADAVDLFTVFFILPFAFVDFQQKNYSQ